MQNIKTFLTQDGSIGLYDTELDEIFHSKYGAKKEAFEKFIEPVLAYEINLLKFWIFVMELATIANVHLNI